MRLIKDETHPAMASATLDLEKSVLTKPSKIVMTRLFDTYACSSRSRLGSHQVAQEFLASQKSIPPSLP